MPHRSTKLVIILLWYALQLLPTMAGIDVKRTRSCKPPLLALWAREDVVDTVVEFLPSTSIACLPGVAKPLRAAHPRLVFAAARRRGKVAALARACYATLAVGERFHFREDWKLGMGQWRWSDEVVFAETSASVIETHGNTCLRLVRTQGVVHRGLLRPFKRDANLLVTRLRVKMSLVATTGHFGAVGYAMLCGPEAAPDATDDFMGGPKFGRNEDGTPTLLWLRVTRSGNFTSTVLVDGIVPNLEYTIDARIRRAHPEQGTNGPMGIVDIWVSWHGTSGIRTNATATAGGICTSLSFNHRPLSSIHLYNYSPGTVNFGDVEVWCKAAPANQRWAPKGDPNMANESESDEEVDEEDD